MQSLQFMTSKEKPVTTNGRYQVVTAPAGFDGYETRRNHYFKTKNAASEFRLRIKRWKAEQKSPTETLSFDEFDKRWLAYLRAHVGNLELLPEIVRHWERTAKAIRQHITVAELARQFVVYRETKRLHRSTTGEDRFVAKRLTEHLGRLSAHEVGPAEIRSFLDTATGDSIERKLYKVASLIFAYGREQHVLIINPFEDLNRPQVAYATPGILQPAEFKQLLLAAEKKQAALVPFLALAGFAGIRREEMLKEYANDEVLQWPDIDWDKKMITIRDGVAKQTSRELGDRRFIPIEAALIHWLEPYRKESGPVVPVVDSAFRRRFKKLREAAELNPSRNALRHSYASYWLARSRKEGLGRLALQMGNSEAVVKRHYLEILSREDGKAWFALRRAVKTPVSEVSAKAA
jgi:site-specific recombinase XerD